MKVSIIGKGNVGTHLHKALLQAGVKADLCSSRATELFPHADIYIIAVKDDAIRDVVRSLAQHLASAAEMSIHPIVAHTSGSVTIDILAELLPGNPVGVFYPLQTFTRNVEMTYSDIPFLIEGDSAGTYAILSSLAAKVSANVLEADSRTRGLYHIASVFACNFTNRLFALSSRFLKKNGLGFKTLLPLIRQTVAKLSDKSPEDAQTGPAARGDMEIINSHLSKLADDEELYSIYRILSDSILHSRKN